MVDMQSGARQILLVEDEPLVSKMIQSFLYSWGYSVFPACNGREALELAEERKCEIDLLLSDVNMPEMDGLELAERLKAQRPRLPVILISGYSNTQFVLQHEWKFIQKPFQWQELKAAIADSLNPKSDQCFLPGSAHSTGCPHPGRSPDPLNGDQSKLDYSRSFGSQS